MYLANNFLPLKVPEILLTMKKLPYLLLLLLLCPFASFSQAIDPDSTGAAMDLLEAERKKALNDPESKPEIRIRHMLDLGMWEEAGDFFEREKKLNNDLKLQYARYLYLNNRFFAADSLVERLLSWPLGDREAASLLKVRLLVEAWRLPEALRLCNELIEKNPSNAEVMYLKGRILLLQKKYPEAKEIAAAMKAQLPGNAGGYLLEASLLLWRQKPTEAERPLRKALELDPLNADARFMYGYAIWRRVDAAQLDEMAAQWELALETDPLHYLTHWHWGNGHTHLTYASYAQGNDDEVRTALEAAEQLFSEGTVAGAIEKTREIRAKYSASVLPLLYRGSYFYSAGQAGETSARRRRRLDSAEAIFREILTLKPHYGPAHSGLASVIRSKRLPFLAIYDSVLTALQNTSLPENSLFAEVFPGVEYYPGELVKKMAWNQLHTAKAYYPFLVKLKRQFHIPPLHKDLAIVMESSYFRGATTFDNRQWMDIRGVGSGAAGVEYVEKAAFLDRNVLLHEYVHLFHGTVMTDRQVRRIRQLYYNAVREGKTLDYYAANNEHEYFAQVYPAYFSPPKVHPLDFKSTNSKNDLQEKDPAAFAFMDSLAIRERAFLEGDRQAMAGNWAETYVRLSERAREKDTALAGRYLDTALQWQAGYMPALISYARLEMQQGDLKQAESRLAEAKEIDQNYAPVYLAYAELAGMLTAGDSTGNSPDDPLSDSLNDSLGGSPDLSRREAFYIKALETERDLQKKAEITRTLYRFYRDNALLPEAIAAAGDYAEKGPVISTYLRGMKNDALAFSASLRSSLGYVEAADTLRRLVKAEPQNYGYRRLFSDALAMNGQYEAAITTLKEAQSILRAAGAPRKDFILRMAAYHQALLNTDSAASFMLELRGYLPDDPADVMLLVRLHLQQGNAEEAGKLFGDLEMPSGPYTLAEYLYTKAKLLEARGEMFAASGEYEKALRQNPFHFRAANDLLRFYRTAGFPEKASALTARMEALEIPPGPGLR